MSLEAIQQKIADLWQQAVGIWTAGGYGMIAIALNALVLFILGVQLHLRISRKRIDSVPERTWRQWIKQPEERRGPIGELLDFVTGAKSLKDSATFFQGLRATEIAPYERDLKIMKICVTTAPLLGLFGTVTGMLATFGALASGSGGEKTMGMIAKGISEALITTETGLVIALPGLFLQYYLARRFDRYKTFLAHLETVCMQSLYRELRRA